MVWLVREEVVGWRLVGREPRGRCSWQLIAWRAGGINRKTCQVFVEVSGSRKFSVFQIKFFGHPSAIFVPSYPARLFSGEGRDELAYPFVTGYPSWRPSRESQVDISLSTPRTTGAQRQMRGEYKTILPARPAIVQTTRENNPLVPEYQYKHLPQTTHSGNFRPPHRNQLPIQTSAPLNPDHEPSKIGPLVPVLPRVVVPGHTRAASSRLVRGTSDNSDTT